MSEVVWGVDPSTRGIALGVAYPDGMATKSAWLEWKLRGAVRLAALAALTRTHTRAWAAEHPPVCVLIEQQSGKAANPELVKAAGVVEAALYEVLRTLYEHPVSVWTVTSGTWKKEALGNGAAKKHEVMAWARERGYNGERQDEADALAIAVAGRALLKTEM